MSEDVAEGGLFIKDVWEISQDLKNAMGREAWDEAMIHIESLLSIESTEEYWVSKGFVLTKKKLYEKSLVCYENALEFDPYNASVLYNLGYSLMMIDRYEKALEVFGRILSQDPTHEFATKASRMCRRAIKTLQNEEKLKKTEKKLDKTGKGLEEAGKRVARTGKKTEDTGKKQK